MINMSSKLFLGLLFVLQVIGSGYSAINWDDVDLNRGRADYNPAASCRQILDLAGPLADMVQNGYYYFQTKRDDVKQMYCNMVDERCGVKGWMRVAKVNASTGVCPENFKIDYAHCQLKVCRGNKTSPELSRGRLYTMTFPINIPFTRVAAFVEGYQFGSPGAFDRNHTYSMDGITFYYGSFRSNTFLWAYAAGEADRKGSTGCPCSTESGAESPYGNYHYCDTGNSGSTSQHIWYHNKPLWTGSGCPTNSTCCDPPDLPYFCRSGLRNAAAADRFTVAVRLSDCAHLEDIGISSLEIYVA
jgi:hypothetical protein